MSASKEGTGKPLGRAVRDFLAANGRKGGKNRAAALTPSRRSEIAKAGNEAMLRKRAEKEDGKINDFPLDS